MQRWPASRTSDASGPPAPGRDSDLSAQAPSQGKLV
jgi:hypothetical protein